VLHYTAAAIFGALGEFIAIFLGSTAIGICFGFLTALIFKHINLREDDASPFNLIELSVMLWFSYIPFLFSEVQSINSLLIASSLLLILHPFPLLRGGAHVRHRDHPLHWHDDAALHPPQLVGLLAARCGESLPS
jgi:NhaP-type Na+/H+ or K+/H+ antiporter